MKNLILLITMILFSCQTEKKEFYENGQLKSIDFFSKESKSPIKTINFYPTGEVKDTLLFDLDGNLSGNIFSFNNEKGYYKWTEYKDNRANGKSLIVKNDGSKITQYLKNDTLYGIEQQIYSDGFKRYVFWVGDRPLFYKEIKPINAGDSLKTFVFTQDGIDEVNVVSDSNYILESVFKIENGNSFCIGSLAVDDTGLVKQSMNNSYVKTTYKRQDRHSDSIIFCVSGFFGNFRNVHLQVELCKLNDDNFDFSPHENYYSKKDELEVCFVVNQAQLKDGLLLARVKLIRETDVLFETYFFEDINLNNL